MQYITGYYGLGNQDGRESSIDWEIVQHTDNFEENIDGEKLGDIVKGKAVSERSCSLLNNYDSDFNLCNMLICICDIDPG